MNLTIFKEFLGLINRVYQLDSDVLMRAQVMYQAIYQDTAQFKQLLGDDGQTADVSQKPFCLFLIFEKLFPCYFDDWKFYCEDLSQYISQYTQAPFIITDEEYAGEMDNILDKLEKQTSFSLLHIWSGGDDVHFYLIHKTDKPKLLKLAQELDIWVE
ncbi:MAG: hypothetical protein D8B60_04260 [Moraxella sp.]|nr:MAG: hypothetical protein D8B60_04260 [Moraxella sp.]